MSNSLWPCGLQHTRLPCPPLSAEFAQTHVHWVSDAIQPSHPLLLPSPPAFSLSQQQGVFQLVSSLHQMAEVYGALVVVLSHVQLFATPWIAALQASLSFTIPCSLLKLKCPLSRWCHPTISSSVIPFSSCLQPFPASGSFPMSRLFASSGHSIGASASNDFQWLLVTWSLPIPTLMLPESVQEYCLKQATFYCKYLFVLSQWLSFYLGIVWN